MVGVWGVELVRGWGSDNQWTLLRAVVTTDHHHDPLIQSHPPQTVSVCEGGRVEALSYSQYNNTLA